MPLGMVLHTIILDKYSSLFAHLDEHNALTDYQHGFRKRQSCKNQLLIFNLLAICKINKQMYVYVAITAGFCQGI